MGGKIRAGITALGAYVPEKVLTNEDLAKIVDTSDEWIKSRTGIEVRHICTEGEGTSDICYRAALNMQKEFDVDLSDVDMILVGTITPDMIFPNASALLQRKLGIKGTGAADLSAACPGFVYAVNLATCLIESGRFKKVLVCGADKMSAILDWEDRTTCVLFGDGGGAVLMEPVEEPYGVEDMYHDTDGRGGDYLYMPAGGSLRPPSRETVENKEHYVRMNGRKVFIAAIEKFIEMLKRLLERNNLTVNDVDQIVFHQANAKIITEVARKMKIPLEKAIINIGKYANTTDGTIPLALYDLYKEGKLKKGDRVILSSFGGGFTWASTMMKWWLE